MCVCVAFTLQVHVIDDEIVSSAFPDTLINLTINHSNRSKLNVLSRQ